MEGYVELKGGKPRLRKITDAIKVKSLERLVKYITGAKSVEYIRPNGEQVRLKDVNVDKVQETLPPNNYADSYVQVDYHPTVVPWEDDEFLRMMYGKKIPPIARFDGALDIDVYLWENPYDRIAELEKELKEK